MENSIILPFDEFMTILEQETNEIDENNEINEDNNSVAVIIGLGVLAVTMNENNNHEIIYDCFDEETIDECVDILNNNIDNFEEEELAYCVKRCYDFINEKYLNEGDKVKAYKGSTTVGAVAGGVLTNQLLQKSQDDKLNALIASGASDKEIGKLRRKQGRARKLATLGGAIAGGIAGNKIGKTAKSTITAHNARKEASKKAYANSATGQAELSYNIAAATKKDKDGAEYYKNKEKELNKKP